MAINTIDAPDSASVFKLFWLCWQYLGVTACNKGSIITIIYDVLLNIFISLWYPMHLAIGLFLLTGKNELCRNLSTTITCTVCAFKFFSLRWKFKKIYKIMELFQQLDERARSLEERKYFTEISMKRTKLMANIYFIVCMGANVSAIMGTLLDRERRLMFPAWFPFDWKTSSGLYYLASLYQFVGATILIVQNFTNDAIAPVTLCLLSGHVRLLAMRVAAIGYDLKKSKIQNEQELKNCVNDHIKLIRLFRIIENFLSISQLSLFISSGLNICVSFAYLVFYADNLYDYIYYSFFMMALAVELFPIYYYGSLLQEEFNDLPYAIFSSNWPEQSQGYRKICLIFVEVSLRELTMLAGGIVNIQLDTFFAICKSSYSLFAVVINLK